MDKMAILVIGDFHTPDRAREVPLSLTNAINAEYRQRKFDLVACTGDLTRVSIIVPMLNLWSDKVIIVQGNMDYDMRNAVGFSRRDLIDVSQYLDTNVPLKIGLTHGHQIHPRGDANGLARIAKDMNASILISGHTHALSVKVHELVESEKKRRKFLLLNPGSATGAWSFVASMRPSFMIMRITRGSDSLLLEIDCREFDKEREIQDIKSFKFTISLDGAVIFT